MVKKNKNWRSKLFEIIYEADTPVGKLFDILLLFAIIASIILVMMESVSSIDKNYHDFLNISEWVITILFSIEYIARIISVKKPSKYIFSFYGIIDLLSTIPKYLSFFFVGSQSLVALRALKLSRARIAVFISFVIILCVILGTIMYLVESEQGSGFTSIPRSVYWAIVTLTTVGYGDIAPHTPLGQLIASAIMILGYGIIIIPTGIITSEMTRIRTKDVATNTESCPNCSISNHRDEAEYCHHCGHKLNDG